jgi:hypothetical protein
MLSLRTGPCYLVDFGVLRVLLVPVNSHLIEMEGNYESEYIYHTV